MRCFIAIELPKEVKSYLYELHEEFKESSAKIRFVAKKQLHVTLRFFADLSEEQVKQIKERLKKIKFKQVKVKLDKLGVFPNENYIRVLWIDLKPAGRIIELKDDIDYALADLFGKDERFSVHVTLGRVKFIQNKEKFRKVLREIKVKPLEFEINEFKFVKSTLTPKGPTYEDLEVYK